MSRTMRSLKRKFLAREFLKEPRCVVIKNALSVMTGCREELRCVRMPLRESVILATSAGIVIMRMMRRLVQQLMKQLEEHEDPIKEGSQLYLEVR